MRCRLPTILLLALLAACGGTRDETGPEPAAGPAGPREEPIPAPIAPPMDVAIDLDALARDIREILMNQQAAWNSADIEGFMAGYWNSPDLVFTSGARVRRGFAGTLESYRSSYAPEDMGKLFFHDLEVRPIGADGAWVLGRYRLAERSADQTGLFTLIFRRFPEGWLIVHDHTSVDADR